MKANFKKIITAIAATAMCAVPMAGSLSANAASIDRIDRGNIRIEKGELGRLERKPVEPPLTGPLFIEKIDKSNIEYDDRVIDYIRAQKVEEEAKKLKYTLKKAEYTFTFEAVSSSDSDDNE